MQEPHKCELDKRAERLIDGFRKQIEKQKEICRQESYYINNPTELEEELEFYDKWFESDKQAIEDDCRKLKEDLKNIENKDYLL